MEPRGTTGPAAAPVGVASARWRARAALPWRDYLELARAVGAEVVDVSISVGWPRYRPDAMRFDADAAASVRATVAEVGVGIAQLGGPDDFVQPAERAREEHAAMVRRLIDFAAAVGTPVVTLCGGRPKQGVGRAEALRLVVAGLARVAPHAEARGVRLALENTGFMPEPELLLRVLGEVGSPGLGALLDTGNLLRDSRDAGAALPGVEALAPHTVATHLGNGRGRGPEHRPTALEDGELDLPAAIDLLLRAGYRGALCSQFEGEDDPAVYARDVAFLRGRRSAHPGEPCPTPDG